MSASGRDPAYARLNELQESLQLYERLQMKNEFLYTMRMYTLSLLQIGDMLRLKELFLDYKLLTSWEEERLAEVASKSGHQYKINQEHALANMLSLLGSQNQLEVVDEEMQPSTSKKGP